MNKLIKCIHSHLEDEYIYSSTDENNKKEKASHAEMGILTLFTLSAFEDGFTRCIESSRKDTVNTPIGSFMSEGHEVSLSLNGSFSKIRRVDELNSFDFERGFDEIFIRTMSSRLTKGILEKSKSHLKDARELAGSVLLCIAKVAIENGQALMPGIGRLVFDVQDVENTWKFYSNVHGVLKRNEDNDESPYTFLANR